MQASPFTNSNADNPISEQVMKMFKSVLPTISLMRLLILATLGQDCKQRPEYRMGEGDSIENAAQTLAYRVYQFIDEHKGVTLGISVLALIVFILLVGTCSLRY
jgi:hypothetical protein